MSASVPCKANGSVATPSRASKTTVPCRVIVDSREPPALRLALADTLGGKERCVVRALEAGDVWFEDNTGQLMLVVERKTLADLCASLADQRFRSQRARMQSARAVHGVLYIVEGSPPVPTDKHEARVLGALQNLVFKHKCNVLHTSNMHQTVAHIKSLSEKLSSSGTVVTDHTPNHRPLSKAMHDEAVVTQMGGPWVALLSCIKGISHVQAQAIACSYPDALTLLASTPVALAGVRAGARRVGPVLAQRIFAHFGCRTHK